MLFRSPARPRLGRVSVAGKIPINHPNHSGTGGVLGAESCHYRGAERGIRTRAERTTNMTLRAHLRRASLTGVTLAVAVVFTAGCNSSSSSTSAAGTSGSASASGSVTASGSVAGSASGSVSGASGASSAASASAPAAAGMGSDCTTSVLKVTTGDGGGGAAGSFYSYIDFTNTGSIPCSIDGYPGVSLTDGSGTQIGAAATRDPSSVAKEVTLAPGATANAQLRMTDFGVYPTSQCHPTPSAYLKIYPPNNTTPTQIPFTGTTCSNSAIKMLQIGTSAPGTVPSS